MLEHASRPEAIPSGVDSRERVAAQDQLEILELVEAAMDRRDEVFEIIDSSEETDEAQERIRELFAVRNDYMSRAVMDIQVSRWTRDSRKRLAVQADELRRLFNA
jgi:DNA gyrase/topoisomerase IV subunit A